MTITCPARCVRCEALSEPRQLGVTPDGWIKIRWVRGFVFVCDRCQEDEYSEGCAYENGQPVPFRVAPEGEVS